MASYTFECKACKGIHDIDMKLSEYKAEQYCPDCGELMERVYGVVGISWKCSGAFEKRQ